MASMTDIHLCETDLEILETFNIMKQLHPNLEQFDEEEYLNTVRLCQTEVGLQIAALKEDGETVCVAGFRLCRNLGWGKYLYVDNLVSDEKLRSRGSGKIMFEWLVAFGRSQQCAELRLDCAVQRQAAHRFYLRERMEIAALHLRMKL
jgi:hypothetical protein